MAPPALRPHTDAVVARLTSGGVTTGNHGAPAGNPPYCAVYLISGGEADGSLARPDDTGRLVFQVTSTGTGPEQSQWVADQARTLLSGWRPTVTGRSVAALQLQQATGGTVRDDDLPTSVWSTFDRYETWTVPA